MINPIALGVMALGVLLILVGLLFLVKRRKVAGITVLLLGLGAAAVPFLVSCFLPK